MKYVKLFFLVIMLVGCGEADRGKAFITSQEGGITVIDLNSMEVAEQIDVGAGYPPNKTSPQCDINSPTIMIARRVRLQIKI